MSLKQAIAELETLCIAHDIHSFRISDAHHEVVTKASALLTQLKSAEVANVMWGLNIESGAAIPLHMDLKSKKMIPTLVGQCGTLYFDSQLSTTEPKE
jgi:hypothetical protein